MDSAVAPTGGAHIGGSPLHDPRVVQRSVIIGAVSDAGTVLAAAADALGRGDAAAAVELCRRGLEEHDDGELHFLLGQVAYGDDQLEDSVP